MFQKVDFRDVCDDHFVVYLMIINDENTYFAAIPTAIICEVAFSKSITPRLSIHFSRQIKSFSKKWFINSLIIEQTGSKVDSISFKSHFKNKFLKGRF